MEFQEILRRSEPERYALPDIFQDTCGLDIKCPEEGLHAVPTLGYQRNNKKRRATVVISSFRGISPGAIHYYGEIIIQGVHMEYDDKPGTMTACGKWEDLLPLSRYQYKLTLTRPITQEEIDIDEELGRELSRFPYQKAGDLTQCWETEQDIVDFAKEVFKVRFIGNWEFYVEYWGGTLNQIYINNYKQ